MTEWTGSPRADADDRPGGSSGVPADQLTDEDLLRELASVHRTRGDTLRHGSEHSLTTHTGRTAELEREYVRRFPDREIDDLRLRAPGR